MQASSWPLLLGMFTGTWTKTKSQSNLPCQWCNTHFIHQLLANVTCFADEIFQLMAKSAIQLDNLPIQLKQCLSGLVLRLYTASPHGPPDPTFGFQMEGCNCALYVFVSFDRNSPFPMSLCQVEDDLPMVFEGGVFVCICIYICNLLVFKFL